MSLVTLFVRVLTNVFGRGIRARARLINRYSECDVDHVLPGRQTSRDPISYRHKPGGWPKAQDRKTLRMEIVLSPNAKGVLATSAADVRTFAEGCEPLPYTTYRENAERVAYVKFLKHAKNAAIYLDCLSRIRGDVSFLLPAVKVEIRRALAMQEYLLHGGMANQLRSRLLCAQECVEAIGKGE